LRKIKTTEFHIIYLSLCFHYRPKHPHNMAVWFHASRLKELKSTLSRREFQHLTTLTKKVHVQINSKHGLGRPEASPKLTLVAITSLSWF